MIIKRIRSLLKIIQRGTFPNKEILIEEHKKLLDLLDSPPSSEACIMAIKAIKTNRIYNLFKLAKAPVLLKLIISKISDYKELEKILNISDIIYSSKEKIVLNSCLNVLELLNTLEADLKEVVEISKAEMYEEEDFFTEHFKELDILRTVLSSEAISSDDIEWFFNSDLFDLIAVEPENFSIKLTDIYQLMIQNVKLTTKEDFNENRQILLNKKTKEGKVFNYEVFSSILSSARKKISNHFKRHLEQTGSPTFYKRHKSNTNVLPQIALKNNLDLYRKNTFK